MNQTTRVRTSPFRSTGATTEVSSVPRTDVTPKSLKGAIRDFVHPSAPIHTHEFPTYRGIGKEFAARKVVIHEKDEFVSKDGGSTNTVESYFALIKRGVYGNFRESARSICAELELRWKTRHSHASHP